MPTSAPGDAARLAALVGLRLDDLDPAIPVHTADAGGTRFVVAGVRDLAALGFKLTATRGTAAFLSAHGLPTEVI